MQSLKRYGLGVALLLLVAVAAGMIYLKLHPKELPANLIEGTGHIDGDLVRLNTKYPGRLVELKVDDGIPVKKGQLVARLSSPEYEAKRRAIQAQIDAKEKELAAKETKLRIAQVNTPQLLRRAQSLTAIRKAQVAELQRQIDAQKDLVEQDRRDLQRIENLFRKNLVQKERYEQAQLKYKVDRQQLAALEAKKIQADEQLRIAQSRLIDAQAAQKKLDALREGIAAFRKGIAALEAQKQEIEAMLAEMSLYSPLSGYTVEKIANIGEVIGAGMPVATLIAPESLYLKIYVDTLENGRIKLHDKAEIFLDARPERPIPAEVVRIAQKAEFTPKEVNVRSDRIQRVFAVHLKPLHPDPLLKLGLPAIGVVSLDGKGLPKSLNEIPVL
ncbi:HlyD family secretion protein [Nitratifractor sp.]